MRESRLVTVLFAAVDVFARTRWLIVRLWAVAISFALGLRDAHAATRAYHRLPALMRHPRRSTERFQRRGCAPIVYLSGGPADMGRQYGLVMRRPLQALATCIEAAIPGRLRDGFVRMTRRGEPHLPEAIRAEIQAMADAADVPYEALAGLNVVTRMSCTTIAARDADGRLLMGRNGDFFGLGLGDRAMAVVVRYPSAGRPTVSVNFLGMVGAFTGMNDAGVAFGNMLVFNAAGRQANSRGLPIQIAQRLAAERADTAAEMAALMQAQSHAMPMNVMAADADDAVVVELGLRACAIRRAESGLLVATNHFRTPTMISHESRCRRYGRLVAAEPAEPITMSLAEMKRALHRTRPWMLNLQAVIFEPAARRMHISINRLPASAGPYVTLTWPQAPAAGPAA